MKAALESGLNVRKSSRAWSSAKLHHQKLNHPMLRMQKDVKKLLITM